MQTQKKGKCKIRETSFFRNALKRRDLKKTFFSRNALKRRDLGKYTFSGIMIISPDLFSLYETGPMELWNDILKPASSNNLVSGEIFKGRYENLNTLDDVERLDGLLSEE